MRQSPCAPRWIERYEATVARPRGRYLWDWVDHGLELTVLPGVGSRFESAAHEAKFLGVLLTVILDDIADGGASPGVVAHVCAAALNGQPADRVPGDYHPEVRLARAIYLRVQHIAASLPGFGPLREFLDFDYAQLATAMRYAALVNATPTAVNRVENRAYLGHNMHMMISGTIDLMARPHPLLDELGVLRELLHVGQRMGRIGNAVTTWERELGDGDVTSAIFAELSRLSGQSVPTLARLDAASLRTLEAEVGAEASLLELWRRDHGKARQLADRVRSFDATRFVRGLEQLLQHHLASRGHK